MTKIVTAFNVPHDDWLAFAAMMFLGGVILFGIAGALGEKGRSRLSEGVEFAAIMAGIVAAMVFVGRVFYLVLTELAGPSVVIFQSHWLGLVCVGVAIGLFILKKRALLLYGAIEVALALAAIEFVAYTSTVSMMQRFLSAATAIYFFVRGLDNSSNSPTTKKIVAAIRSARTRD